MVVIAVPQLPWRKVFGVAAVIVLHIAIVAVLLRAMIVQRIFRPAPSETILLLPPPQPKPIVRPIEPPARLIAPPLKLPDYRGLTIPLPKDENARAGADLGFQLFDCRFENLSKLTDEQRARCAKSRAAPKTDDTVDFADHTNRARDATRWAREKERKNLPGLLPCASSQSVFATLSTGTILCLAHGAISGFDLDARPLYNEKPEEIHVPNGGDPPPPYVDPDH
jgi:hypothetical protein